MCPTFLPFSCFFLELHLCLGFDVIVFPRGGAEQEVEAEAKAAKAAPSLIHSLKKEQMMETHLQKKEDTSNSFLLRREIMLRRKNSKLG